MTVLKSLILIGITITTLCIAGFPGLLGIAIILTAIEIQRQTPQEKITLPNPYT